MSLLSYCIRRGYVTGKNREKKNTSHSALEVTKKWMISEPQFMGGEQFLVFGNCLHLCWLNLKKSFKKGTLTAIEYVLLNVMLKALRNHPIACRLRNGATVEQKIYVTIMGVLMSVILDIEHRRARIGADLKTTSCKSERDFIDKAILYGYFRQAITYMIARSLKEFYFVGITKEQNPQIFILDVSQYPEELRYARQEFTFLLYFDKHYGSPTKP